jgi:hypothetical protein
MKDMKISKLKLLFPIDCALFEVYRQTLLAEDLITPTRRLRHPQDTLRYASRSPKYHF